MTPREYFEQVVPQQYAAAGGAGDQPELTATYVIGGDEGGTFALRAAGDTLALLPSPPDQPDMLITQSYADWAKSAEAGAADMMVDYIQRRKVAVVKSLRGTVTIELTRSDGSLHETAVVFGGQAEPAVTIQMTTEDYRDMMSGELNGNMAFMMGKLKFEGSLPLLMQVGALSG